MIIIRNKVTKMGNRRFIEISKNDYDVIKVGDKVTIIKKEKENKK